jgi:hypothetical protein
VRKDTAGLSAAPAKVSPDADLDSLRDFGPAFVRAVADQYKLRTVPGGSPAARAEIGTRFLDIGYRRLVFWQIEVVFWRFPADDLY